MDERRNQADGREVAADVLPNVASYYGTYSITPAVADTFQVSGMPEVIVVGVDYPVADLHRSLGIPTSTTA